MGNTFVFRNHSSNFVEQLKIDSKSQLAILGIYINPNEFPTSGLIIVSERSILSYNPKFGNLTTSYNFNRTVLFTDYNRKSKDGSIITCVTDDMKCYFISTENLTVNRTISILTKADLRIKDNSKISCINFHLNDALLMACSDGSVIKCKLNDEPVNLLYEIAGNKFKSPEDEFESIKNVFSSDTTGDPTGSRSHDGNLTGYIQSMLISDRYKVLFCIQKNYQGVSNISLFNLRNNTYMFIFCKIKGIVKCACLADKRDLLLIINFSPETKKTILEFWEYKDHSCPISTYDISSLLDYKFTISSICLTQLPNIFYGRNSVHGKIEGDIITMGSSKGDILVGSLCTLHINNKPGYEHIKIYKLSSNSLNETEDFSNKFEISYISYDLNFDVLYLGDVSSNVRFIEKILQLGKKEVVEENLPFINFSDEPIINKNQFKLPDIPKVNYDLPIFSINHDIIKDRSIILYDKGKNVIVKEKEDSSDSGGIFDEEDEEDDSDTNDNEKNKNLKLFEPKIK